MIAPSSVERVGVRHAVVAFSFAIAVLGASVARADDEPRILEPVSGVAWPGSDLAIVTSPPGVRLRVKGPGRVVNRRLRLLRPGVVELVATDRERSSEPVRIQVLSIANAALGEGPPPTAPPPAVLPPAATAGGPSGGVPGDAAASSGGPSSGLAAGSAPPAVPDGEAADSGSDVRTHDAPSVDAAAAPSSGGDFRTGWDGKRTSVHDVGPVELAPGETKDALAFEGGMNIDADGAGGAWRQDRTGQPTTSLTDSHGRSLDPTKTPYVVLPLGFERDHPGVHLGDIVAVQYHGKTVYAIYGDRGPHGKMGEASIATARALGINPDPNHGGTSSGVTYTVFPGSGTGRPLSNDEMDRRGASLLAQLTGGGSEATKGMTGSLDR